MRIHNGRGLLAMKKASAEPDGDELGEINIIVGIVNGAEASGFSREGDDILAKKGRDVWVGRSGSRGGR